MALIGTIRKNFWFVLIVLGLALAAFILMDMKGNSDRGGSAMVMGEISGQKVDYRDFSKAETALYSGNPDIFSRRENLWDYFIEKAIVEEQASELGLGVTKAELMDLQFGNRLSPVITNNYRNAQTGQVDRASLLQHKQLIEGNEELAPRFESFWVEQEKQIQKTELQNKIGNLVSKAIYTPKFLVEETGAASNSSLNMSFVKIPFDAIDTDVEVSDADISAYMAKNATKYTSKEETRVLQYAVVDVYPSAKDSADWRTNVIEAGQNLKNATADSDSIVAFNNGGFWSSVYFSNSALPEGLKGQLDAVSIGDTYGPYAEQGSYFVAKVLDKKIMADSAEVKHILRNATTPESFASAEVFIDSLQNELNRGAKFSKLAEENSQDPGSASKGGDFGTFPQGALPPTMMSFNNVVFNGKAGGVYKVRTQFGVHLVKVEDLIYNDRNDKFKVAYVRTPIIPSEETQNLLNDKINDLISQNRDMAAMSTAASAMGYNFQTTGPLKANDFSVGTLGSDNSSRDMVKWAFESDTQIGEVSPTVYAYSDKINYFDNKYVIASLKNIQKPGLFSAESMRSTLESTIANIKKGESIVGSLGSDLSAVAAKYGSEVGTADGVSMGASFIPGIGTENKVIARAFATDINGTSSVIGTSGVFLLSPTDKTEGTVANIPQMRQLKTRSSRSQAELKTIEALKKTVEIADNRATFF